jgi:TfoX/Sxy family transcriptional regulator of competence genes
MFGEYGLYTQGKYFALVCDNTLFFKSSKWLIKEIRDDGLRAYEGSKNSLHIPEDLLEDHENLPIIVKNYFENLD